MAKNIENWRFWKSQFFWAGHFGIFFQIFFFLLSYHKNQSKYLGKQGLVKILMIILVSSQKSSRANISVPSVFVSWTYKAKICPEKVLSKCSFVKLQFFMKSSFQCNSYFMPCSIQSFLNDIEFFHKTAFGSQRGRPSFIYSWSVMKKIFNFTTVSHFKTFFFFLWAKEI